MAAEGFRISSEICALPYTWKKKLTEDNITILSVFVEILLPGTICSDFVKTKLLENWQVAKEMQCVIYMPYRSVLYTIFGPLKDSCLFWRKCMFTKASHDF